MKMLLRKTLLIICSVWMFYSSRLSNALVVPQELPSLLSVVYSNIPPIKKGTDSRLGFGFRLGEHADFQVLLELGPQKETRPIGDQDGETSFNKRQVSKAEQNAILRQQLRQQQLQQRQELTSTERNAASWLESWSQDMNAQKTKSNKLKTKQRDNIKKLQGKNEKENSVPRPPILPPKTLQQLQLLYKLATTTDTPLRKEKFKSSTEKSADEELQTMADRLKKKAQITRELMDVSLEEST